MKKLPLLLGLIIFCAQTYRSQCVITCSNYEVAAVTPSLFPTTGNDVTSSFFPNNDDGYTSPIPLGFNFNYYCTTYSTVLIYSNGLIQFDIGQPSTFPFGYDAAQSIPSPNLPTVLNGIVCFRMDDLDPSVGGTITYTTIGTSPNQAFVVTYSAVPVYGNPGLVYSGQIILYETSNEIEIHTIDAPQGPNLATQGIEDETGTKGLHVPGRNQSNWSSTNTAYRFTFAYAPTPPTSVTGPTLMCNGDMNSYSVSAMPGATLYTWTFPPQWSGSGTTTGVSSTGTAGVSGNVYVAASYTCGISAPALLSVSVVPLPFVSITSATPSIFCAGQTVTFNVTGASTYTLEPGNIMGTPPFTDTPPVSTTYTLSGTDIHGCNSKNLATTFINVKANPTITVNNGSVCVNETFLMTPSGAATYTSSNGPFWAFTPTVSGIYEFTVVGTGSNGCVGEPAINTLTAVALPNITAVASRTSICTKETTTLTAGGGATYTWTSNNNSTLTVLSVTPFINTTYFVTGTSADGCVNSQSVTVKVNTCVGLNEVDLNDEMSVFPNPSNGSFVIKSQSALKVVIYDINGKEVLSTETQPGENPVQLEHPSGQYFLKASDGSRSASFILIRQ